MHKTCARGVCETSAGLSVVLSTMMECFKWLFIVVIVLICGTSAQNYWMQPPVQKPQPPLYQHPQISPFQHPQQTAKVPPPAAPLDKCRVQEEEKIHCGSLEITAEQCEAISCCFDGRRCYYGKAGMVLFVKLISNLSSCN